MNQTQTTITSQMRWRLLLILEIKYVKEKFPLSHKIWLIWNRLFSKEQGRSTHQINSSQKLLLKSLRKKHLEKLNELPRYRLLLRIRVLLIRIEPLLFALLYELLIKQSRARMKWSNFMHLGKSTKSSKWSMNLRKYENLSDDSSKSIIGSKFVKLSGEWVKEWLKSAFNQMIQSFQNKRRPL